MAPADGERVRDGVHLAPDPRRGVLPPDEGRRSATLEALRRLRGTYGQILLISHAGGIEYAADMALSVEKDDEEEVARVTALA
jgi:hypothetical protein